jgi:hypothetical protein
MDKLIEYPKLLKRILAEYVELCNRRPNREVETFLVVDPERQDYIWMNVGWQNGERVSGMTTYVRIRDGKFWVEEDWTEDGIATDLVREGVPKEDIVLAFHDPETRKETEFAAA